MAAKETIFFQPYVRGARGALEPGAPIACHSGDEGIRRAEKAMASGSIVGAHVVKVLADDDAGEYGEPEYLAALGDVPDGGLSNWTVQTRRPAARSEPSRNKPNRMGPIRGVASAVVAR